MDKKEFLRLALLSIASNSAFGNQQRNSYQSFGEWAEDVEQAAKELLHVAERNWLLEKCLVLK